MAKDYIPSKDADFDVWYQNIVSYVGNKVNKPPVEWTHIPVEASLAFFNGYTDWHAAYTVTLYPHVPADIVAKNDERKKATGIIRPFVKQYLRVPPVTNADRENMGVSNYDASSTPVQPPKEPPELTVDTGTSLRLHVHYRDPARPRGGKPEHVTGIELLWAIRDAPPDTVLDLVRSSRDTASPLELSFEFKDRGKKVYMAGRWTIHRENMVGPLSPVLDVIIP
jgi:hypothetical protein